MTIWVLMVYIQLYAGDTHQTLIMQEFDGRESCEVAGAKVYELSGRKARWTCVRK